MQDSDDIHGGNTGTMVINELDTSFDPKSSIDELDDTSPSEPVPSSIYLKVFSHHVYTLMSDFCFLSLIRILD